MWIWFDCDQRHYFLFVVRLPPSGLVTRAPVLYKTSLYAFSKEPMLPTTLSNVESNNGSFNSLVKLSNNVSVSGEVIGSFSNHMLRPFTFSYQISRKFLFLITVLIQWNEAPTISETFGLVSTSNIESNKSTKLSCAFGSMQTSWVICRSSLNNCMLTSFVTMPARFLWKLLLMVHTSWTSNEPSAWKSTNVDYDGNHENSVCKFVGGPIRNRLFPCGKKKPSHVFSMEMSRYCRHLDFITYKTRHPDCDKRNSRHGYWLVFLISSYVFAVLLLARFILIFKYYLFFLNVNKSWPI